MRVFILSFCLFVSMFSWSFSFEALKLDEVKVFFEGLSEYASKSPFSKSVRSIYLGFDAEGVVQKAVGVRRFKSYEMISVVMVIKRADEGFLVEKVYVPDLEAIAKESDRKKVLKVVEDFSGRLLMKGDGDFDKVDAVTGATRYHGKVYSSFNLLAKKVIETMKASPSWERLAI